MPEWMVRLQGHEFDMEELSTHFTSAARNVKRDEDGYYYLRSSDFNKLTDPSAVRERALEMLGQMNGAVKLLSGGSYRPVEFDVVTEIDESGKRHHHVMLSATVEGRSRVTVNLSVGGQDGGQDASPSPSEAEVLATLADQDEKVADVLRFIKGATGSTSTRRGRWFATPLAACTMSSRMAGLRSATVAALRARPRAVQN